ncbi:hypothetical protein AB1E18_016335 [Capra hircus]
MHPAAEDNYGYDACAVLCLPCVANVLVITTESGMLHHCVVLEGEEDNEQTSEKSWDSRADLIPSLSAFCMVLYRIPDTRPHLLDWTSSLPLHWTAYYRENLILDKMPIILAMAQTDDVQQPQFYFTFVLSTKVACLLGSSRWDGERGVHATHLTKVGLCSPSC